MKKHLLGGVQKGVFNEEEAEKKFEAWKNSKLQATHNLKSKDEEAQKTADNARLDAEKEVNKAKAEALAKKRADEEAANKPAEEAEEQPEEEVAAEAPAPAEEATPEAEAPAE